MAADDSLRDQLTRRLLGVGAKLPTSTFGRFGRAALTALRGRRAFRDGASPDVETLTRLLGSLGQLKGLAMKVGQLVSYLDLGVAPELQAALSVLQTHSPPMPFDEVARIIEHELGSHARALLAAMHSTPAAAASIGQVQRASLPDGTAVAVKVQYPDIEKAIGADFRPAAVGTRFVALLVPGASVDDVVAEARRAVLEECDYEREATYQERFARIYEGHRTLAVPRVHRAYCSRHVLTTSWVDGLRLDEFLARNPSQAERDRYGEAIFEFYVGTPYRHGLYNWDPHPGNYVFQRDGRLTMLDYGSTREFSPAFVRNLVALRRAVHADTREALHDAFLRLGVVRAGVPYNFDAPRAFVRALYGPMLRDAALAIEPGQAAPVSQFLANKRGLLKLHLPPEILFIVRIRFGVMSVLARLGARANWYQLECRYADGAAPGLS
jgi:predicted unusual protein kinase regulating ubiquinone biosynthesis (AarF/ABC1/UbiB family)